MGAAGACPGLETAFGFRTVAFVVASLTDTGFLTMGFLTVFSYLVVVGGTVVLVFSTSLLLTLLAALGLFKALLKALGLLTDDVDYWVIREGIGGFFTGDYDSVAALLSSSTLSFRVVT